MPDLVPLRIIANLETRADYRTGAPVVTIACSLAQKLPDGRLAGVGTHALALNAAALYEQVDPATGEPNGVFVTGETILAIFAGLARASQGA